MGIVLVIFLMLGIIISIIVAISAYIGGTDAREKEVRWTLLYGRDCYDNTYIIPFNYVYDAGYAAYDKRKERAKRNKDYFKRK